MMISPGKYTEGWKREGLLVCLFFFLTVVLWHLPTGFENRIQQQSKRCRGRIIKVEDNIQQLGMIKKGYQDLTIRILDGRFKGKTVEASNQLMGRLDIDKLYRPDDIALVVLTLNEAGDIIFVNAQDHYRIGLELFLLFLFAAILLVFGGWTGLKAIFSFVFAALMIWKLLVPLFLKGIDPVWLSLAIVSVLSAAIIFLVAGLTRKGIVAFCGAFSGVFVSCLLSLYFTKKFHVHGAVMPFAETLLYSGFGHLDLTRIYIAAVFLAASGAVMDLAMDVAAGMDEVMLKKPDLSVYEAMKSGLTIGRAVVGTMTTTLLLAYSGGYITLLMAFMAQGVPLTNVFNLVYVAAEVLKTLVGSFGLVTVAPFTAVVGAFVYAGRTRDVQD